MILRGILDRSLSSQLCIRGFAPIRELAKISKPDYSYQRNLIDEQQTEISNFLDEEDYLFFPEVILSFKVKQDLGKLDLIPPLSPLQQLETNGVFKSNVDRTEIKFKSQRFRSNFDVRGSDEVRVVELILDSENLTELIATNSQPFNRVDGNHRLSAALKSKSDRVEKMVVPFCIILSELISNSTMENWVDENEKSSSKFEKVVFHNINTKSIPLKSEENLRVILDDEISFPDEEIKSKFGERYLLTRELGKNLPTEQLANIYPNIKNGFKTDKGALYKNSVLFKLISFLHHNKLIKTNSRIDKITDALQKVNNEFYGHEKICKTNNSAFFISAVGIELHPKINLRPYIKWLAKNHIGELREVKEQSLYDIYLKINEQSPKVFVAMPYFSEQEVESYNSAYKRVVDRINAENTDVNLELFPIMSHNGMSRDIIGNMVNQIDECSIFIADASGANANVAYELGYAKSKNKAVIIVIRSSEEENVPFDYEHDLRKTYNSNAINTLENVVFADIKAILIEKGYSFD